MDYTTINTCRACGGSDLERVLDLGRQPLANSYVKAPVELSRYPLELMVCRHCFHNQLSIVVAPELMFREYLYVSGTSRTLRDHFDDLVRQTIRWFPRESRRVLDIACNDGTLLEAFRRQGFSVVGVDPATNLVAMSRQKGLDVVEGFWPKARDELSEEFDIITAANVLAHVADPRSFLEVALNALTPNGAVILEFPYARSMILNGEWDTIYHEHLSYFLARPLAALVESVGALVTHAQLVPIHGGSLRLAIQRTKGGHCSDFLMLATEESCGGLGRMETYRHFARRVDEICDQLQAVAIQVVSSETKLIGFGASAKGNTLLNRCPLPLSFIVDDNSLKHGHLTPGQLIQICSPTVLPEEPSRFAVLLLAWNFANEIVDKIRAWRPGRQDRVIHYVPKVVCHAIDKPLPRLTESM